MTIFSYPEPAQCRGRNPFKADAIRVGLIENHVYVDARVASTGKYSMGWLAIPNDPDLLLQMGDEFHRLAEEAAR